MPNGIANNIDMDTTAAVMTSHLIIVFIIITTVVNITIADIIAPFLL